MLLMLHLVSTTVWTDFNINQCDNHRQDTVRRDALAGVICDVNTEGIFTCAMYIGYWLIVSYRDWRERAAAARAVHVSDTWERSTRVAVAVPQH
jgi:hypothetical protein